MDSGNNLRKNFMQSMVLDGEPRKTTYKCEFITIIELIKFRNAPLKCTYIISFIPVYRRERSSRQLENVRVEFG